MSRLKLIYDNAAEWEKDYIQELFVNLNYEIVYVEKEQLQNNLEKEDEIINNNILVFSSNVYTFEQILKVVLRLKPLIIVHLSDETGTKPRYTHLASYTKLLLHQYHFNHYPYHKYNNIIQIPLGYMKGMFNKESALNRELKPLLKKKYVWSFIGTVKQDRKELINKFSKRFIRRFVGNNIAPSEMFNIYNDSVFVPNGRGFVVLDCFRIYESILSGSIPIIVCEEPEFKETFYYNNDIPPFIFEKTWDAAVNKCLHLLNNVEELEIVSQKNYEWLQKKIKSIQEVIHSTLN